MAAHNLNGVNGIPDLHSFIVRIWLEERESQTHPPAWHGHITDIGGGERHYFKNLNEIPEFIKTHLNLHGETDS